jgi:DnaJ-class molecular chaperone
MSEQTKECEACVGTGNDMRMRSPYPIRKILFQPCPTRAGTGKVPKSPASASDSE